MSGAEGKVDYYLVEDVPHTMFFDIPNEIALHGAYWHDRFGYKHSHGCVNMPPLDAEWVFNWSADTAPINTQATDDEGLWVWVHTSDPQNYLIK
jgi:lipoprotein-anchoring transpeptidase ErfK/SrfK